MKKKFEKSFFIKPGEVDTADGEAVVKYVGEKIRDTSAELMIEAKEYIEANSFKLGKHSLKQPIPGKKPFSYVVVLEIEYEVQ